MLRLRILAGISHQYKFLCLDRPGRLHIPTIESTSISIARCSGIGGPAHIAKAGKTGGLSRLGRHDRSPTAVADPAAHGRHEHPTGQQAYITGQQIRGQARSHPATYLYSFSHPDTGWQSLCSASRTPTTHVAIRITEL